MEIPGNPSFQQNDHVNTQAQFTDENCNPYISHHETLTGDHLPPVSNFSLNNNGPSSYQYKIMDHSVPPPVHTPHLQQHIQASPPSISLARGIGGDVHNTLSDHQLKAGTFVVTTKDLTGCKQQQPQFGQYHTHEQVVQSTSNHHTAQLNQHPGFMAGGGPIPPHQHTVSYHPTFDNMQSPPPSVILAASPHHPMAAALSGGTAPCVYINNVTANVNLHSSTSVTTHNNTHPPAGGVTSPPAFVHSKPLMDSSCGMKMASSSNATSFGMQSVMTPPHIVHPPNQQMQPQLVQTSSGVILATIPAYNPGIAGVNSATPNSMHLRFNQTPPHRSSGTLSSHSSPQQLVPLSGSPPSKYCGRSEHVMYRPSCKNSAALNSPSTAFPSQHQANRTFQSHRFSTQQQYSSNTAPKNGRVATFARPPPTYASTLQKGGGRQNCGNSLLHGPPPFVGHTSTSNASNQFLLNSPPPSGGGTLLSNVAPPHRSRSAMNTGWNQVPPHHQAHYGARLADSLRSMPQVAPPLMGPFPINLPPHHHLMHSNNMSYIHQPSSNYAQPDSMPPQTHENSRSSIPRSDVSFGLYPLHDDIDSIESAVQASRVQPPNVMHTEHVNASAIGSAADIVGASVASVVQSVSDIAVSFMDQCVIASQPSPPLLKHQREQVNFHPHADVPPPVSDDCWNEQCPPLSFQDNVDSIDVNNCQHSRVDDEYDYQDSNEDSNIGENVDFEESLEVVDAPSDDTLDDDCSVDTAATDDKTRYREYYTYSQTSSTKSSSGGGSPEKDTSVLLSVIGSDSDIPNGGGGCCTDGQNPSTTTTVVTVVPPPPASWVSLVSRLSAGSAMGNRDKVPPPDTCRTSSPPVICGSKKPMARIPPFKDDDINDAFKKDGEQQTFLKQFGLIFKQYDMKNGTKSVKFRPHGLVNRSNWCFVNSVLQALGSCAPFFDAMKLFSDHYSQLHPVVNSSSDPTPFESAHGNAGRRSNNQRSSNAELELLPILKSLMDYIDGYEIIVDAKNSSNVHSKIGGCNDSANSVAYIQPNMKHSSRHHAAKSQQAAKANQLASTKGTKGGGGGGSLQHLDAEVIVGKTKEATSVNRMLLELSNRNGGCYEKQKKKQKGEGGEGEADDLEGLSKIRVDYKSSFSVMEGRQEDAEELLTFLLNGMNDEMTTCIKKVSINQSNNTVSEETNSAPSNIANSVADESDEDWREVGRGSSAYITRRHGENNIPTPISSLFQGQLRSCVQPKSGEPTFTLQPFFTLPLDIHDSQLTSVSDALAANFTSCETLDGFVDCNTGLEIEATRSLSLEHLPPILILHLKRFIFDKNSGGCQKILKQLNFSTSLEIGRELLSTAKRHRYSRKQRQYNLFSVIYHSGVEANKGHYVTDILYNNNNNNGDSWLRCDDCQVKVISESTVIKHTNNTVPYILCYRRADTF